MKITAKNIKALATHTKSYVEKHHALPESFTIDNVKYTYPQIGYILAKATYNPGKDIEYIKVKKAPNNKGEKVSFNISKKDYIEMAKKLVAFIEKKHDNVNRLPNFIKYQDKKIKQRVFIYAFAKIIVWYYNNNKTLPDTCKFKTSETVAPTTTKKKSKYGHATKQGCDNMGQNTGYYCGCHSLQEIFRNLTGYIVPQSTIASIAGTTTSGTDHEGLNTVVAWFNKKYNTNLKVEWKHFSELGWSGLKKVIDSDDKDLLVHNLYRNQWGHYEVINGISDSNIKVQNSLGSSCSSGCYCGYVENRTPSTYRSYILGISQKSIMIVTRG